jgi:mono/diheme cytochrome c family protein
MTKTSQSRFLSVNSGLCTLVAVTSIDVEQLMLCQFEPRVRFSVLLAAALILFLSATVHAEEPGWTKHVSDADKARPNPVASDPAALSAGQKLYADKCGRCHGANGEGKGHSPSLQTETVHALTPGELEWVVAHGFSLHRMPAFESLSQDERWQIVAYVQSLPKAAK